MKYGGVGVFDSGIGGLTLLKECDKALSGEVFYYYGDNLNAPYGEKTKEEMLGLVKRAFCEFEHLRVKKALIACNTVTAECIGELRKSFSFPIYGLQPALKPALKKYSRVLVLATAATLKSGSFNLLLSSLKEKYPKSEITLHYPKGLVEEIEKSFEKRGDIALSSFLPEGEFDCAVLGCTHYIFLREKISDFYKIPTFDGNSGILFHAFSTKIQNKSEEEENEQKFGFLPKNRAKNRIFFLGSSKKLNFSTYKQMFAL